MPTLKQLTCSVEWEHCKVPLPEYQTTYSDGYVETYIAVPELPIPFSIHLQSSGYIAPGLSMFVYIDGVYQCNRNRQNLKIPNDNITKRQTEVNFRVRQMEQMAWDGSFYGKPWKFERANIVSETNLNERAPHDGEYVGTIEVVVLRCLPSVYSAPSVNPAKTPVNGGHLSSSDSSSDSDGLPNALDGARDLKLKPKARFERESQAFGLDGYWDDPVPSTSPVEGERKPQDNSWDSWSAIPAATEDPGNTSWGEWNAPASGGQAPTMGTIEMTSANTGIYHASSGSSSSTKAAPKARSTSGSQNGSSIASVAGSRAGSQRSNSQSDWNKAASAKGETKAGLKPGSIRGSQAGSQTSNSWGNWNKAPSAKEEPKGNSKAGSLTGSREGAQNSQSWKDWSKPSPADKKPEAQNKAGSAAGSQTGSQHSQSRGNWNQSSTTKEEPKKSSAGTASSNTGIPRFSGGTSSTKAADKAGHQPTFGSDRSHRVPSATGQLIPRTLELRGGGVSSYSAHSRRGSAAGSPVFNVGFYNGVGTPPPLGNGPPPPRDWRAEEAAKRKSARQETKSTAQSVVDAWADIPADVANGASAGAGAGANDKVDDWNAGGNDMPGAWGTANDQSKDDNSWGEKPQENNDNSWGAPQDDAQNNDTSNDAGKDSNWAGAPNGNAENNKVWPGAGIASDWDEPAKDDNKQDNDNEPAGNDNNDWGGNANNEAQPSADWNSNDNNDAPQGNNWSAGNHESGNNTQNGGWGNNDAVVENAADNKPASVKGSKKGSKGGSILKNSNAGSLGQANAGWSGKASSMKSKGKSPPPKGPGSVAGSNKGSAPGGWSPPPNSKQGISSQAAVLSVPSAPKFKPYWSTWKDPNAGNEDVIEEKPDLPAEDPLYAIPSSVAARNSTSHQVRPGPPATYTHKVSRPKYMDSHSSPYAIFAFHYRSKATIETLLGTTISEPEIDEKQRLSSLPKAELIQELLREKARSASAGSSGSEKAATFKSNPRGIPIAPDASALKAKLNTLEGSKAATPDMVGAWMNAAPVGNGSANGGGFAGGKGNQGKKGKNKGGKNKGGGNWAGNQGNNWGGNDQKKDDNAPAGDTWNNKINDATDEQQEEEKIDDNDDGNWGGFDQNAGATSWDNNDNKEENNANGGGDQGWGEVAATNGAASGGGGGW